MRKNQKGFTIFELFVVVVALVSLIGWISNIVRMFAMIHTMHGGLNDPHIIMFIVRIVGIPVAPLGVVVGYMPT